MKKITEIECFLLDMDGTFYLGEQLIEGARQFINTLKKQQKQFVFLTNNSSKNTRDYCNKLENMGVNVSTDRIVTSGEVTASYIKNINQQAVIYLVGTKSLKQDFINNGLKVANNKNEAIDFLVVSFDTSLHYQKLWDAHDLILKGVNYIATNPDRVCPLAGGKTMPDCGAIIELLKTSTGKKPLVIGKPNTLIIDYVAEKTGINPGKMALIGDRLYTDIKTAIKANICSILVLSGETKKKDLTDFTEQIDFVYNSIKDIYRELG